MELWFLLAGISAILSAGSTLMEKKTLFTLDALDFSFLLSVVNMLLALPFLLFVDHSGVSLAALAVLAGKSALGAVAFLNIMYAIKNLQVSGALPLLALTPGFVAISAFFILGERLTGNEMFGLLLLVGGIYVLETKPGQKIYDPFVEFFTAKFHHHIFIALLIFTFTALLDKTLLTTMKLTPYAYMGYQHIFLAVIFALIMLYRKRFAGLAAAYDWKKTMPWLIAIGIGTIGYRYTQIEAFKLAPVALVLSIKRTSVFMATVAGGKLFGEDDLLKRSFAAAAIIAGAILLL